MVKFSFIKKKKKSISYLSPFYNILIAPAGFGPEAKTQGGILYYRNPRVIENTYGITRKNLESQEQGPQRLFG